MEGAGGVTRELLTFELLWCLSPLGRFSMGGKGGSCLVVSCCFMVASSKEILFRCSCHVFRPFIKTTVAWERILSLNRLYHVLFGVVVMALVSLLSRRQVFSTRGVVFAVTVSLCYGSIISLAGATMSIREYIELEAGISDC